MVLFPFLDQSYFIMTQTDHLYSKELFLVFMNRKIEERSLYFPLCLTEMKLQMLHALSVFYYNCSGTCVWLSCQNLITVLSNI